MMIHDVMVASARPDLAISRAEFPPHQTRALARPIAHARITLPPFYFVALNKQTSPGSAPFALAGRRSRSLVARAVWRLSSFARRINETL